MLSWLLGSGREEKAIEEALDFLAELLGWLERHPEETARAGRSLETGAREGIGFAHMARTQAIVDAVTSASRLGFDEESLAGARKLSGQAKGEDAADAAHRIRAMETLLVGFYCSNRTYPKLEKHFRRLVQLLSTALKKHCFLATSGLLLVMEPIARDLQDVGLNDVGEQLERALEHALVAQEADRAAARQGRGGPRLKPAEAAPQEAVAPRDVPRPAPGSIGAPAVAAPDTASPAAPSFEAGPAQPIAALAAAVSVISQAVDPVPAPASPPATGIGADLVTSVPPPPALPEATVSEVPSAPARPPGDGGAPPEGPSPGAESAAARALDENPLSRTELFTLFTDEAFKDGCVEEWENKVLVKLATFLRLAVEEARNLATASRGRFERGELGSRRRLDPKTLYAKVLQASVRDGVLSKDEQIMLSGIRKLFGITDEVHLDVLQKLRSRARQAVAQRSGPELPQP